MGLRELATIRAHRFHRPVGHHTVQRLLDNDLAALLDRLDTGSAEPPPPIVPSVALVAVQRLTTLFADVARPDLEVVLDDPRLVLENADLFDPRS
jgi:hypothetical protein